MKKAVILLSGCGYHEGTNPWEIAFIISQLERLGVIAQPTAPDELTYTAHDYTKNPPFKIGKRNILAESSHIVRGEVLPISGIKSESASFLIIPGGLGTVKHYITDQESVYPPVARLIRSMFLRGKPIGAIGHGILLAGYTLCKLAPLILALPNELEMLSKLEKKGATFVKVNNWEVVYDEENGVFSTPGIDLSGSVVRGAHGIETIVDALAKAKKITRSVQR
ncbi:hypothetical protein J7K18_06735 [bacterium]|nr:hypothetical protein [bacterium]